MSSYSFIDGFATGILVAFAIFSLIFFISFDYKKISLSEETANDICKMVTNNETAVAIEDGKSIWHKKLICEVPSYDSTQNIIIKENNDE